MLDTTHTIPSTCRLCHLLCHFPIPSPYEQVGAKCELVFPYFAAHHPPPPHPHPAVLCPPLPTYTLQVGAKYEPLFPYFAGHHPGDAFKVVSDGYVTDDSGTGVVHQAPAFGEDDYRWAGNCLE